jgi:hypothetical protein
MTRPTTDQLIASLAADLKPARPLPPPAARLAIWMTLALGLATLGVALLGPRADLAASVRSAAFLSRLGIALTVGLLAASASLVLGVPGAERDALHRAAPLLAVAAWLLMLGAPVLAGDASASRLADAFEWACAGRVALLAIPPGVALYLMLRRAAPLRAGWTGSLAALGAAAVGAAAVQCVCPVNSPAHLLVAHAIPVLIIAVAGIVIGRLALRDVSFLPRR